MLKILQARLQQYVNHEDLYAQAGFRKGKGTGDQIANIHWINKKKKQKQTNKQTKKQTKEFQKSIYFCFIDYAKTFDLFWIITNYKNS